MEPLTPEFMKKVYNENWDDLVRYFETASGLNDPEDLAQQTLIKFWSSSVDISRGWAGYLWTIAKNLYRNDLRGSSRSKVRQMEYVIEEGSLSVKNEPSTDPTVLEGIYANERVSRLDPALREVLRERLGGAPVEEQVRQLGVSRATYFRRLSKLQRAFSGA